MTQTKRPSHEAFLVEGEGDKAHWTKIGALWAHDDGDGFNLQLIAMPINGRLVIRKQKAKSGKDQGESR